MRIFTAAFLLLTLVQDSFAWNGTGHRIIAFIAYSRLTPKARSTADRLLAMHPMLDGLPSAASHDPRMIFADFATWPDLIKSDRHFVDTPRVDAQCRPESLPRPSGPVLAGFPDMQKHQDWHYFDTPFSTDGTRTYEACRPNALTQLEALLRDLADAGAREPAKAFALPWVLHLTGDVHQPLHATSRFSSALPEGDRGGNSVKLKSGANLHAYWDDALGGGETEEYIARAATAIMAEYPPSPLARDLAPRTWLNESFQIARSKVYSFDGSGTGNNSVTLSADYKKTAKATARERAALAGYRLAGVLNRALR